MRACVHTPLARAYKLPSWSLQLPTSNLQPTWSVNFAEMFFFCTQGRSFSVTTSLNFLCKFLGIVVLRPLLFIPQFHFYRSCYHRFVSSSLREHIMALWRLVILLLYTCSPVAFPYLNVFLVRPRTAKLNAYFCIYYLYLMELSEL